MLLERIDDGTRITLRIAGALEVLAAPSLRQAADRLLREQRPAVAVDLSDLRLIDSAGVGVIVALYKRVREAGGHLQVVGLRDQPLAVFRLLRLDALLARE